MSRRRAACGTESGYRRHRANGEVTCQACCDAHAVQVGNWRARARVSSAINPLQYLAARVGREPADALVPGDRARLVAELHARGWDDTAIASHTRMTTYTTARIRGALGLLPNRPSVMEGAA